MLRSGKNGLQIVSQRVESVRNVINVVRINIDFFGVQLFLFTVLFQPAPNGGGVQQNRIKTVRHLESIEVLSKTNKAIKRWSDCQFRYHIKKKKNEKLTSKIPQSSILFDIMMSRSLRMSDKQMQSENSSTSSKRGFGAVAANVSNCSSCSASDSVLNRYARRLVWPNSWKSVVLLAALASKRRSSSISSGLIVQIGLWAKEIALKSSALKSCAETVAGPRSSECVIEAAVPEMFVQDAFSHVEPEVAECEPIDLFDMFASNESSAFFCSASFNFCRALMLQIASHTIKHLL